jgi:hypothetical protein
MNRQFSNYASAAGKANLAKLVEPSTDVVAYSYALYQLGTELGEVLAQKILDKDKNICVACTVEDADFLAKGIIDSLTGSFAHISLACFWNNRQQALSIAPILRKYREPDVSNANVLIVIKSVISGACVVKTNLTNLIQDINPESIFVVAPVIHTQAPEKLNKEFPSEIAAKFSYLYFAQDFEKQENGNLVPGIGGEIYQRLGFKNQEDKNSFTPQIVKNRRQLLMQALN